MSFASVSIASEVPDAQPFASPSPGRWTQFSLTENDAASQTSERRLLFSRSPSAASAPEYDYVQPEVLLESPGRVPASSSMAEPSKQKTNSGGNAEVKTIVEQLGRVFQTKYATLRDALRDVPTDPQGNVRRCDVRRLFGHHHVPVRMADRVFDHMMTNRRGSTVPLNNFKDTFHSILSNHLYAEDSYDGSEASRQRHHHHNVHGKLRPRHSLGSHCSVIGADEVPKEVTKARLARIAKQIGSNHQTRYIDKYGTISRPDIQKMFESYGLRPYYGNALFDSIDTERTGEIKFKDLHDNICGFLRVDERAVKGRQPSARVPREGALDDEAMQRVCDHLGSKAAAKHKTVRDVFRFVDRNFEEEVDRFEIRHFFRNYGCKTTVADRFFDRMDANRTGKVHLNDLKCLLAPFVQPGYSPPTSRETQRHHGRASLEQSPYAKDGRGPKDDVHSIHHHSDRQVVAYRQQPQFKQSTSGRKSNASSMTGIPYAMANTAKVVADDELHMLKFGRFQGSSTYSSHFDADMFRRL